MKYRSILAVGFVVFLWAAVCGAQQPLDLSAWKEEQFSAGGAWRVQPAGSEATFLYLTNVACQSVLLSDVHVYDKWIRLKIKVDTSADDDYFGFVLGFRPGDSTSAQSNYLVIDWKQTTQGFPGAGTAKVGLALSRVTGVAKREPVSTLLIDFWSHTGVVNELARAATLGSVGWQDFKEYTFDILCTPNRVTISVNGTREFNVATPIASGRFGLYNYSQGATIYRDVTIVDPFIRTADRPAIGNRVKLSLYASQTGKAYAAGCSLGNLPGIRVGGRVIPLNIDDLLLLSQRNPIVFRGFRGMLDASGNATAAIDIPNVSGLVGLRFHSAFLVLDPAVPSGISVVSAAMPLQIVR